MEDDVRAREAPDQAPTPAGVGTGRVPSYATLVRALEATPHGVTVVDLLAPDQPLVYANAAFGRLAGLPLDEIVGRNCRFLQGPDTDPAAIAAIRTAVEQGAEYRVTLLNHRGPRREPWWNEVQLTPVADASGRVVQYIGVQQDVTARVTAERAVHEERERTRGHLARLEELATTDPLTGLLHRGRMEECVETALWDARAGEDAVVLVSVDLEGFAEVNDRLGTAVGDALLQVVAGRLRGRLRRTDLVGRLVGDRFLVALPGLDRVASTAEGTRLAVDLAEAVSAPVVVHGHDLAVEASVGVAIFPEDGEDFAALLRAADRRRTAGKPAQKG